MEISVLEPFEGGGSSVTMFVELFKNSIRIGSEHKCT